jgi:hypothetical protein
MRGKGDEVTVTERWLAPGLLMAVAVMQLFLAWNRDLSPWKGGGFGMFSSVDAPSMRVVSGEAQTVEGRRILVHAMDGVGPERRWNMRAMPGRGSLESLGASLLSMVFVPVSVQDDLLMEKLLAENPELGWEFDPMDPERRGFYRPVRAGDPLGSEERAVRIRGLRLRWWRVGFDFEGKRMKTEPMGEVVELGEWMIGSSS